MNSYLLFVTAMRSLRNHKIRSLLTTLGIIIGVVSIIAVMSIGEGAKYKVSKEIEKLGSNFIIVLASAPKHFIHRGASGNLTLKPGDLKAIKDECLDIAMISPGVQTPTKIVSEGANWQTLTTGVAENYLDIRQWKLTAGEFFTDQDVRSGNKVAVLGKTVAKELFGINNPVGKTIRIKKLPFKVLGVVDEKGKSPDGRDQDDTILAPITTVQRKIMGKTNYAALLMSAVSKERMSAASSQVRSILRQRHRLQEHEEDDFTLFTQDDISQATDAAGAVLNILLLVIASIALLVGGIGIMNIMLVTVTERTKEIGIRMALGATTTSILNQFILEAITICLIGGLMGATIGIAIAKIVGIALQWPIFISKLSLLISLGSSVFIGLFFGYYPAYKASRLDPVEALIER